MKRLLRIGTMTIALLAIMVSTMGTAVGTRPASVPLIAHASTLTPAPQIPTSPKPPAAVVIERVVRVTPQDTAPQKRSEGVPNTSPRLNGLIAGVIGGNNCVACVRQITGYAQNGNAGTWRSDDSHPDVGDVMIFRPGQQGAGSIGHVGVVAWTDGQRVKLRHCNWGGGQVDFYSTGYFWRPR